jgi:large subunit ribosomal protein L23
MKLDNYDVIRRVILSEKSSSGSEQVNLITFEVDSNATKQRIKESVEKVFKVRVLNVNTLNRKPRNVVFKGKRGTQKGMKVAYVTLHNDDSIDIFNQKTAS